MSLEMLVRRCNVIDGVEMKTSRKGFCRFYVADVLPDELRSLANGIVTTLDRYNGVTSLSGDACSRYREQSKRHCRRVARRNRQRL